MAADNGGITLIRWRVSRRELAWLAAEVALLAVAFPLYYLLRGIPPDRVAEAGNHAIDLIDLEEWLGIFREADLQGWVLPHGWLVDLLNQVYLYFHLPLIFGAAGWLYFWRRPSYMLLRNALLISGAIGLVVYALYPVTPPRLLPAEFGFEDTIFSQYGVSRPANPPIFRNEHAAVPSLHFGWNVLAGVAIWLADRNLATASFVLFVVAATLASIVFTANHYFLDAVAGLLAVAVGLVLAVVLQRAVHRNAETWVGWLAGAVRSSGGRAAGG